MYGQCISGTKRSCGAAIRVICLVLLFFLIGCGGTQVVHVPPELLRAVQAPAATPPEEKLPKISTEQVAIALKEGEAESEEAPAKGQAANEEQAPGPSPEVPVASKSPLESAKSPEADLPELTMPRLQLEPRDLVQAGRRGRPLARAARKEPPPVSPSPVRTTPAASPEPPRAAVKRPTPTGRRQADIAALVSSVERRAACPS